MPPTTEEGLAAESRLDDKLAALYASESAVSGPVEDTPDVADTQEAAVETPQAEDVDVSDTASSETPPEDPEIAALLSKYGGDANQALKAAVEAQKLIGRQGSELAEYRREFEDRIAEVQQQAQAQIQALQAQSQQQHYAQQAPTAINAALEQGNYYAAAESARQANDPMLYNHVMTQWFADPDQAFGAQTYHTAVSQHELREQLLSEVRQELGGLAEATQPLLQQSAQSSFEREFQTFAQGKADIQQVAPAMLQVAQEYDAVIQPILAGPDAAARQQAFQFLYTQARDRVGDTLASATAEAQAEAAAAAKVAKTQATVGSPTSVSQAKPTTAVEKAKAEFRAFLFNDPYSIQRGLTRDP